MKFIKLTDSSGAVYINISNIIKFFQDGSYTIVKSTEVSTTVLESPETIMKMIEELNGN